MDASAATPPTTPPRREAGEGLPIHHDLGEEGCGGGDRPPQQRPTGPEGAHGGQRQAKNGRRTVVHQACAFTRPSSTSVWLIGRQMKPDVK